MRKDLLMKTIEAEEEKMSNQLMKKMEEIKKQFQPKLQHEEEIVSRIHKKRMEEVK